MYGKEQATVTMIHEEFDGAADKLLAAARDLVINTETEERLRTLSEMGFSNTKEQEDRVATNQLSGRATLAKHYEHYYSQNKFVTEEQVTKICKKYGLVRGEALLFTGGIPEKNQREITGFKCREEDKRYESYYIYSSGSTTREHITYAEFQQKKKERKRRDDSSYSRDWKHTCSSEFFVVAKSSEFNMSNHEVKDSKLVLIDNDPIVLYSVMGGYLVVSKWGDEAKDVASPQAN
jgi:hypothetical protein